MRSSMLLWTLLLTGCPGDPDDSDTDIDTDTEVDTDSDTEGSTGSLSGDLTDEAGAAVVGGAVHMCAIACIPATVDGSGHYAFEALAPRSYTFVAVPPDGIDLAEPSFPVLIEEDVAAVVDVVLPDLDLTTTLPGTTQEVEFAPGFFIQVAQGDVTIPFEDDPTEVAGTLVDLEDYPADLGLTGTVIALWYLDPFDAPTTSGLPIRLGNSWSLPVGNTYELWEMSYGQTVFIKTGDFTAATTELTSASADLTVVTSFALVDPGS